MGFLERWSYEYLGQWHYVLGYTIVLLSHNWPLVLVTALCLRVGWELYRQPERARVCLFFGALLLGVTYEYGKHIAPTLHSALDMILGREAGWLNGPAHALVGPGIRLLLFAATTFFLGQGFWLDVHTARQLELPHSSRAGRQR